MTNSEDNQSKKQVSNFARYSGISIQMLATIGVFSFIGYKIDTYNESDKLIFTAILGLVGVVFSLYQVVKSLNKNQ